MQGEVFPASEQAALDRMRPLIRSLARKYANVRAPFEDLCQEGALGVLMAYRRYGGQTRFTSFAYRWAQGKILHYLRDKSYLVRPPPGRWERLELNPAGAGCVVEMDALTVWQQDALVPIRRDWVEMLVSALSPPERKPRKRAMYQETPLRIEVLRLLTAEGLSAKQAAEKMGLSVKTIQWHTDQLYHAWGVSGLIAAYNLAMARGLIEPPSLRQEGDE